MSTGAMLFVSVAALLLGILIARKAPRYWTVATVAGAVAAALAAISVLRGGPDWEWRSTFALGGEGIHLRLDGISAMFLALLSMIAGTGALYAGEYWTDKEHPRSAGSGRMWWNFLVLTMMAVLVCANGLHFLMAWELFAVGGYYLITLDRQKTEVRAAGWLYLAASHAGTLLLFAFFACLAAHTGSWDLGPMRERSDLAPFFWLALGGFGIKAGLFVLHIWLPSAHANAPSHVSAMLSGVAIKMGIYGLVRFSGWLPMPHTAGAVVALVGVVSAVFGVAFALGQHDMKRLLAYHSVENIGIILIGLGFAMIAVQHGNAAWGTLALAGGLLHVWNHGLFKALLFFGAGSVLHATGTREMSRLGGLWRTMPWTAGFFGLGAVAICGLPPLNGFVSEWLVYLGLFDATILHDSAARSAIPAAVALGITGGLALACFIKVCGIVFLGAPRSQDAAGAHECGPSMRNAMLVLASACVAIGLAPTFFWPAIARAVGSWQPAWAAAQTPDSLAPLSRVHVTLAVLAIAAAALLWRHVKHLGLKRQVTWDCGYAAPSARMQYTVGSFADVITEWFAFILRPIRHMHRPKGTLPRDASFEEHTPETVLEHVVTPVGSLIMRVSLIARRLQHGHVQSYVFYIFVGLAVLAVLVIAGGGK